MFSTNYFVGYINSGASSTNAYVNVPMGTNFVGISGSVTRSYGPLPQAGWGWTLELVSSLGGTIDAYLAAETALTAVSGVSGIIQNVQQINTINGLGWAITLDSNVAWQSAELYAFKAFPIMSNTSNVFYPAGSLELGYGAPAASGSRGWFSSQSALVGLSAGTIVDPDFIKTSGWSQMSCRGFGLTPSQPVLSVELVYHIEGPPIISGQYGSITSGGQYPYVDKSLMDEALEYAAKKPHFQMIAGGRSGSALTNMALN